MRKLIVTVLLLGVAAAVAAGSSTGSTRSKSAFHSVLVARLTPKAEVKKGSPKALGSVRLTLNTGKGMVCWKLSVNGLDTRDKKLSAYVHKGKSGKVGPPIVPLGSKYSTKGCVRGLKKKTLTALGTTPRAYYVNVYTKKYLGGAVRGQLGVG